MGPETSKGPYTYAPALGYSNELIHIYSADGSEESDERNRRGGDLVRGKAGYRGDQVAGYGRVGSWTEDPSGVVAARLDLIIDSLANLPD